jgi:PAS domain-containing protein
LDRSKRLYTILTRDEASFIWVSQSWLNYLGWTFEEITEAPFTDFIHPDDMERSMVAWERFIKTGKLGFDGDHFINRYKTKEGFYKEIVWEAVLESDSGYYMMEAKTIDA